jgi:sugar lactone lactonase YvrE
LFDKTGKFIKQFGKKGTGLQGEFDQPHSLAFDSKGRLFVADRSNNRIQILDAKTFATLDTWYQFSRLSGIYIDKNDMIYGADSESGSVNPAHGAWKRGIRIGSAKDGKVIAFIPDPSGEGVTFSMVEGKPVLKKADGTNGPGGTLAAEGVVVDSQGIIYGAEVGPHKLQRYTKK